ncbi:MAG: L-lactate dehydrogenase [Actinomycetota bacterium]
MNPRTKVAIVGAGAVGTSLAYALLIKKIAGEVVLYDLDKAKVDAEILDLAHGSQFTNPSRVYGGDDIEVVRNSDIVVITAGAKQQPGQSRLDLTGTNISILQKLMPDLVRLAPEAIFLLVTNPCDVLAYAALRISGLPGNRVFSSGTVLDSSRLRWQLAQKIGVSTESVHAMIVGEHGDSEFPLWSEAKIGPVALSEWRTASGLPLSQAELDEIAENVKNAAYKVIAGKGATNYAIGLSATRIIEAVLRDESVILPVSSVLNGYLGVSDVALSVPTVVNRQGAFRTIPMEMSSAELERFQASAKALRETIESLGI